MPWHMIIDQTNAAAESNGRFFNKTNQFELILPQESANRFELRINMLYRLLYNTRAQFMIAWKLQQCLLKCIAYATVVYEAP